MTCAETNHQRISFASDLGQSDIAPIEKQPSGPVRRDTTLLDSSNFEFHASRTYDLEDSSPADEIFADGMILPVLPFQVTSTTSSIPKSLYKYELPPIISSSSSLPPLSLPLPQHSRKYNLKKTPGLGNGANLDLLTEKPSKSFWSFKRSSSLNSEKKKNLICSFPLVTRSNSTGSMLRDVNKRSLQRHGVTRPGANLSFSSSSSSSPFSLCCSSNQFRPQKQAGKNGGGGGGGSFRITPVIGGPSPFGLGSILRFSKDKKTKKN